MYMKTMTSVNFVPYLILHILAPFPRSYFMAPSLTAGGGGGDEDDDDDDDNNNNEDDDDNGDCYHDCCEEQLKVEKEVLQVISVWGTGSDLEMMSIKKAYDDTETMKSFNCRAWVKMVHPFHPIEFIRSLLAQFHKNVCPEQDNTVKILDLMVATDDVLIEEFKQQLSQKFLVVLEDVTTMVDWEAVRGYLPDKKNGSCIVVHTRHHGIACSCVGHPYRVSELEKFSADYSVRVIFKEVRSKS